MSLRAREIYRFGEFELDASGHVLQHQGTAVSLTPKAIDTLTVLVREHGRIVDRDSLMKAVWPDTFVEDGGLTRNISVLRKTLENDSDGQRFIETIPKRGYRFVAHVEVVDDSEAVPPTDAKPALVATIGPSRRWIMPFAAVAAIVAVMLIGWRLWSADDDVPPPADDIATNTRVVILPFENLTGNRNDDWLARGLSEALLFGLRNAANVTLVTGERVSEFYREEGIFEAASLDAEMARRIARRFGVKHFVHGSFQHSGDDVRVVARLMTADASRVESQESVTDRFTNILGIQDQLAVRFAASLEARVSNLSQLAGTSSVDAYRAFVEASALYRARDLPAAQKRVEAALALDPRYARALALDSQISARSAAPAFDTGRGANAAVARAIKVAQEAIAIEPGLYDAHVALALAYREAYDAVQSRKEALAAMALNPRIADAFVLMADSYNISADFGCARDRNAETSDRYYRASLEIDPTNASALNNRSGNLFWANRVEESLEVLKAGLAISPRAPTLRIQEVILMSALNRPIDPAVVKAVPVTSIYGAYVHGWGLLGLGDTTGASKEFGVADARLAAAASIAVEIVAAYMYGHIGHADRAVAHLRRAIEIDGRCADVVRMMPLLARVRELPQVAAILAKPQS